MRGYLDGITAIELGELVAVPRTGKLLREFGTRVIKVEPPETGDRARDHGPFLDDLPHKSRSGLYLHLNAGKESVTLDVTADSGRRVFDQLLARADVLLHAYRPSELAALGLAHDSLLARHPRLVIGALTGFGQSGPRAEWRATDLVAFHAAGVGHRFLGDPQRRPLRTPVFLADAFGALVTAQGVLVALRARDGDGVGQIVDVASAETLAAVITGYGQIAMYHQAGALSGPTVERSRGRRPGGSGVFPCVDGMIQISFLQDNQWARLVEAMERPEWATNGTIEGDQQSRRDYADRIYAGVSEWTVTRTRSEVFAALNQHGVPCAPRSRANDVFSDPHLRERGSFRSVRTDDGRCWEVPGRPWRQAHDMPDEISAAPALGEHTAHVLTELEAPPPGREAPPAGNRAVSALLSSGTRERAALAGTTVLSFGWVWAGSVAAHALADFGATVLKVEAPHRPDLLRSNPPLFKGVPGQGIFGLNAFRNQLSCAIDVQNPHGRALIRRLLPHCDAVIENFRPGAMARLGIDYANLAALRPDLVMLSMGGFGQQGPYRSVPSFGSVLTALGGMDSLQGYPEDGDELGFSTAVTDPMVGFLGATLLLAALRHRDRTGRGDYIDLAQLEQVVDLTGEALLDFQMNGRVAGPQGNADRLFEPHEVFPCRGDDEWIAIAITSDDDWLRLVETIGSPAWSSSEEYLSALGRRRHRDVLVARIGEWTARHDAVELAERLQGAGIAAGPALPQDKVLQDDHFLERGAWVEVEHALGPVTVYGVPAKLSRTPGGVRRAATALGADTALVLRDVLNLSDAEIAQQAALGAIMLPEHPSGDA